MPIRSRFDDLDIEEQAGLITQIMWPVIITMVIVIVIVKTINFPWQNEISSAMAYVEKPNDSSGTKLLGSLLNAAIFVGIIVFTTVIFVVLYKYRCLKIIFGWLFLSTMLMLGSLGGYIFYMILVEANIPMDYFTFAILLWNFSVVGIISIFWHAHVTVNQGYLIAVSAIMAIVFTRLPEWTTWTILAAVAVYDLFAVLCPKGPLRILVETAQERDEPIPALVYNASVLIMMLHDSHSSSGDDDIKLSVSDKSPKVPPLKKEVLDADDGSGEEQSSKPYSDNIDSQNQPGPVRETGTIDVGDADEEPPIHEGRGVKLGLGDFIFYSVLVGRAALFDIMTVFSSFIGIVTGLFATIMLLAVWKKALPALPISIFFGIIFFVLTRIFLFPFVNNLILTGVEL